MLHIVMFPAVDHISEDLSNALKQENCAATRKAFQLTNFHAGSDFFLMEEFIILSKTSDHVGLD